MKMQSHNSMWQCGEAGQAAEEDDNISIEDEIERERRVFQNRRSGVTILQTCNLLEDLEYQVWAKRGDIYLCFHGSLGGDGIPHKNS